MYRISFRRRSVTEVNTPGAMTTRSIFENQSSTWFSHDEYVGVIVEPDVRMGDEKGADLLRLMSGEIVDDDVDFASPRLRLDDKREEGDKLIAARRRSLKRLRGYSKNDRRCGASLSARPGLGERDVAVTGDQGVFNAVPSLRRVVSETQQTLLRAVDGERGQPLDRGAEE